MNFAVVDVPTTCQLCQYSMIFFFFYGNECGVAEKQRMR